MLLLHGADFVPELLLLLAELLIVGATTLGGIRHGAGLCADAVGGLRAGLILTALLVVRMNALALLVADALLLALLLAWLAAALAHARLLPLLARWRALTLAASTLAAATLRDDDRCRSQEKRCCEYDCSFAHDFLLRLFESCIICTSRPVRSTERLL